MPGILMPDERGGAGRGTRCQAFQSAWAGLNDTQPLPEPLARHLRECAGCRTHLGSDPSRLFASLRGVAAEPAPAWEGFWKEAEARVLRAAQARRSRRAWSAAAAAVLLLIGSVWLLRPGALAPPPDARLAAGPAAAGASTPLPTLEAIASPGARVVDFKIFGHQDQFTEVILIFDEGIDL